jgi:MarR family 2-MHQ and catechol resistance regulon transcriptional repressor
MNDSCRFSFQGSHSILSVLLRAAQRVESRLEGSLGEAGLSIAKLGVLEHLVQAGEPLPLGQIAGRISCVKSNVTQLVDRLESDGFVVRVSDQSDRRCIRAAITDQGRERYQVGALILRKQEEMLLESVEISRREEILSCLAGLGRDESKA